MLTVAIVDDEEQERRQMNAYIARYQAEHPVNLEAKYYTNGMELLQARVFPDLVFTDIDMPLTNGLEMAKRIRETNKSCVIVFITRLAQYAINGYEVNALDFVVKPMRYGDFCFKMEKAIAAASKQQRKSITVTERYTTRVLPLNEILYIESNKHKMLYHMANGEITEAWETMQSVAERLSSEGFQLCNACYLVNLRYVSGVSGDLVTVGTEELKISRQRKKAFLDALTKYGG